MRRRICSGLLTGIRLLSVCLVCIAAQAQSEDSTENLEPPAVVDDQQQQRRERTFTAGVLLLVGVTTVGLLLIVAAIVWGAKVRRLARRPETKTERQDELWYLRNHLPPTDATATRDEDSTEAQDRDSAP